MRCAVYKSLSQLDYYLFVREDEDFTRVPDGLRQLLGTVEKVMTLELNEQRRLAQADVREVIMLIDEHGYFLQMPPRPGAAAPS
jgi:uncharacterized protein YcgL (UPF0745 family)